MNIQSYRSSFTVFVLDGDLSRGSMVTEDFSNGGYEVLHLLGVHGLQERISDNPPHIIVMNYSDSEFCLTHDKAVETINWIQAKLPEVHIIVLAKDEDLDAACELYDVGVYDVLEFPVYPALQMLRALDRAALTDYYIYMNEQLRTDAKINPNDDARLNFELFEIWNEQVRKAAEEQEVVQVVLNELRRHMSYSQVVFLKHVRGRSTLVADSSAGIEMKSLKNVGIDLKQTEPSFKESQLLRPEKLVGLVDLVRSGFDCRHFAAFPVIVQKEVWGVVLVLLGDKDPQEIQSDGYLRICINVLGSRLTEISLTRKLMRLSVFDEVSETLNRDFFVKKLKEEITRARRINTPVALLIIQLDQFKDISLHYDAVEVERFLKAIVTIFLNNSRTTDLFGRLIDDQFGLILPHTDRKGAAIKAERLRRILESANFSEVLGSDVKVTLSIGVSEYPSVCHDASDLLKTADEALLEVIKFSNNRVCVASMKPGFVPDFQV